MADEEEDLSPSQTEKLIQFQDFTGIDDINRCRRILQQNNWDIEVAVQDTLNEAEGLPPAYAQPPRVQRVPAMNTNSIDQRVITVVRRPQGLVGWTYFIFMFPFRLLHSTLLDIVRFIFRLFRPDPRRVYLSALTDPVGDVMNFIQVFEEKYGLVHPTFYRGTYSQALNDAKKELKFLLVYLHGPDHQDTDGFCRETLCNTEVVEFMNTRMLFWACSVSTPEGYRVSQALRESTYPFLALIVLRDTRMTVVARIEGPVGNGFLMERLSQVIADNEGALVVARADRQTRNLNQSIRQQQDEAYEVSLRADQEKERKRKEELERQQREEEEARMKVQEEQKRKEEVAQLKIELADQVPEEPATDSSDCIKTVLKLPDGTRLERRFLRDQSMKYLYYYVFCHDKAPDDFQIVTNFPRRELTCRPSQGAPDPPSFTDAGLGKSEMLFVHDNTA
ncbi:PREDICTED: FAS-associated factor 2-like [Priapulus caudatus]|uniref:FAS-associated factor 2-like n=1 Tax=Priapulus caudatus TaxID=37621 RepID=A0ABM1E2Z5_PRICU|nr:PREDICTED: FAS-associated factor 2-like [Priapulus caudatus]